MRKIPFVIVLVFLILTQVGIASSQLPFSLEQYRKYIEGNQPGQRTGYEQVEQYQTPPVYEPDESLAVGYSPQYSPPGSFFIDTLPYFDEPVIIDNDTVQVIRKATPRFLKRYGADFFRNIAPIQTSQMPISDRYILGSGDELLLNMWGGMSAQYELTVDREGSIYIPQVGKVAVAGLTLSTAEEKVKNTLSSSYSDFSADLTLAKLKAIRVFVVGQVNYPGVYDIPGFSRVISALSAAGGPDSVGSFRDIAIYRGNKKIAAFDMYKFISEGYSKGNIQLATGDVVVVSHYNMLIKLRGLVKTPAEYELFPQETISDLLDFAGYIQPGGNGNSIFIDRIIDGIHSSVTIDFSDSLQCAAKLWDGDDISVFPINPFRQEIVFLDGYIPQVGAYGWFENMKISDIFADSTSLFEDTYMDRVTILRETTEGRKRIISANLKAALSGDSKENIALMPQDRISVHSIWEFTDEEWVYITGSVRAPGRYPLYEGMRVYDLIFEASGFKVDAFLDSADIVRIDENQETNRINMNLTNIIENSSSPDNYLLYNRDFLFIRGIADWQTTKSVTIVGEIEYPGEYALLSEDEKLSDIIARAGGITKNAFLEGGVFIRPAIAEQINRQNILKVIRNTQELTVDSLGEIDTTSLIFFWDPFELNRMIIDLTEIVRGKDDIVMEDGDTIFIPRIPDGVSVVGAVGSNGTVKYYKGKSVKYYINRAGGLTRNADKGEIRLVKPNGKVLKVSFGYNEVRPGDVIIVPQRIEREYDYLSAVKDVAMILSGIATTLYILLKL